MARFWESKIAYLIMAATTKTTMIEHTCIVVGGLKAMESKTDLLRK
jgi:hypothetical protein